ncbi:unnamed protein product [Somion occarium]|uniref:Uncharacterized protein n=1 Tax=Somion occarium TaxID=3059160 RepID=A0ABP1CGN1_9APHY
MATIAQHPPAMKVGGRRLSVNSRPKQHPATEQISPTLPTHEQERTDYPRPAGPGEQQPHEQHHYDDHEEVPRKERKQGHGALEYERRMQESLYRRAPKKDTAIGKDARGGRIDQPAGKGFVV